MSNATTDTAKPSRQPAICTPSEAERCLRKITLIGQRVTETHRQSSWRQRTRSASINFTLESLYQALNECQVVLRCWQTIGSHCHGGRNGEAGDISAQTKNIIVKNRLRLAQQNFAIVFPNTKDFNIVSGYVLKLGQAKFRLLECFVSTLSEAFPSLPREVLQLIWEYSQCGPPPKYHVRRNDFPPFNAACFDDHDGWTAFVELKTVVNSIYRAVIKRGFRNSNLDCLRPMIDTCLRNIDRVIICQNR